MCTEQEVYYARKGHPDVRYYYFGRQLWARHRGIVTAGVMQSPEDPEVMRVAYAFCSPLDQFRRFSGEPVRKRVLVPCSTEHPNRELNGWVPGTEFDTDTAHKLGVKLMEKTIVLPQSGGITLVNARLGLCEVEGEKQEFVEVPKISDIHLIKYAILGYRMLPATAKPRLWKGRILGIYPVLWMKIANSQSQAEAVDVTSRVNDPWARVPGYIPLGLQEG